MDNTNTQPNSPASHLDAINYSSSASPASANKSFGNQASSTFSNPESPKKSSRIIFMVLAFILVGIIFGGSGWAIATIAHNQPDSTGSGGTSGSWSSDPGPIVVAGNNGFGTPITSFAPLPEDDRLTLALLKLHNEHENSCYSPLSVRYALEMLNAGASGDTKAQITNLLGSTPAKHYDNIDTRLNIANSLWVQDSLTSLVRPDYLSLLQTDFNADIKSDSFQNAQNINAWVSEHTAGLIDEILSDESVQGMNALLINALAIDMEWVTKFPLIHTSGKFFNFDQYTEEIDYGDLDQYYYTTMFNSISPTADSNVSYYYNFANAATVFASDLQQYGDSQLQFIAIMPDNLPDFIQSLDNQTINALLEDMSIAKPTSDTFDFSFSVYIPKFRIGGGVDQLGDDLRTLGVTDAFDSQKADFSPLIDLEGFAITDAKQKTLFDFSEEGIKATAVTAVGGLGSSGPPRPVPSSADIVVSINKPFLYLVRDKDSGDVWFIGTVYEPNRWNDDKAAYNGH